MRKELYSNRLLQWAGIKDYSESLENSDIEAIQSNPLCGDRVTIQLKMDGTRIKDLRYQVRGCILCKASCAIMAGFLRGLDIPGLKVLRDEFEGFLKSSADRAAAATIYEVFSPVRPHKRRHQCVLLPYETALKAVCEFTDA